MERVSNQPPPAFYYYRSYAHFLQVPSSERVPKILCIESVKWKRVLILAPISFRSLHDQCWCSMIVHIILFCLPGLLVPWYSYDFPHKAFSDSVDIFPLARAFPFSPAYDFTLHVWVPSWANSLEHVDLLAWFHLCVHVLRCLPLACSLRSSWFILWWWLELDIVLGGDPLLCSLRTSWFIHWWWFEIDTRIVIHACQQ